MMKLPPTQKTFLGLYFRGRWQQSQSWVNLWGAQKACPPPAGVTGGSVPNPVQADPVASYCNIWGSF